MDAISKAAQVCSAVEVVQDSGDRVFTFRYHSDVTRFDEWCGKFDIRTNKISPIQLLVKAKKRGSEIESVLGDLQRVLTEHLGYTVVIGVAPGSTMVSASLVGFGTFSEYGETLELALTKLSKTLLSRSWD